MNKIKTTYERPTTDILVIRFEGGILTNSLDEQGYSTQRGGVPTLGDDDEYGSF